MSDRVKIALRPTVRMDDIDLLAWRDDWDLVDLLDETDKHPRQVIYSARGSVIHYIEDTVLGRDYVVVEGPRGTTTADTIRTKLDTLSLDEVLAQLAAARDGAQKVAALHLLAAAAPYAHDRAVFDAIADAFHDRDPEVRIATALATDYVLYAMVDAFRDCDPEVRFAAALTAGHAELKAFRELLASVVDQETDPEARQHVSLLLECLEHRWR
jgi:hypothetical protein